MFNHKAVLVTGGTGSFGKKFIEHVLTNYTPRKVIVFSRDEMKQHEMAKTFRHGNARFFIGDIRDPERLRRAFYGVDIVIHAAALKIVPSAEYNPFEFIKTNILGSENVINAAIDCGVDKVIAISTDKAANPINLYGATKLCAEKIFIAANKYTPDRTKFSVVRYGNVIGSRGSVIPYFQECSASGSIPITDIRMTRFWLKLEEAVRFVVSSLDRMHGGEVFVPKLASMKVVDLARAIAPNCELKIVGIRPGEKLHETLVSADDARFTMETDDCFIVRPFMTSAKFCLSDEKCLPDNYEGYRSDNNNRWLSEMELKELIKQF